MTPRGDSFIAGNVYGSKKAYSFSECSQCTLICVYYLVAKRSDITFVFLCTHAYAYVINESRKKKIVSLVDEL